MSAAANLPRVLEDADVSQEDRGMARALVRSWMQNAWPGGAVVTVERTTELLELYIARALATVRRDALADADAIESETRLVRYWKELTVARTKGLCGDPVADSEDAADYADRMLAKFATRFPRRALSPVRCADDRHVWPATCGPAAVCLTCGMTWAEFRGRGSR